MEDMFKRAFAFNQPIGIWDVNSVTNMEDMFRQDSAFNQPIGDWDVSSVTTMECIFQSASAFNQDINDWVVGSVKNMSGMFSGASAFNQRISDWDVSTVTDMSWMFSGASAFDQSLTGWDINSVTTMEEMFKNVTLSTINYDSILTAWAAQPVQSNVVFHGGNSQYSTGAATTARGELSGPPNSWIITDGGQVFTVTTQAASAITATTATGNGTILSVGSGNATNRGVIYYPYTGTDKIIGDAAVTNVSEHGNFGAAVFTASLTGLSANARYNARAHATNTDDGTKYGTRVDFWTLAKVPSPPSVINPTANSLDVAVNPNGNPVGVLFAIEDSALVSQYLQANGSRCSTAVWQTAAQWDTITVTGLSTGVTYYFRVKAKNENNEETAFGLATAQNTCANPTNGGTIGIAQKICRYSAPDTIRNISPASNYGGTVEYQWQFSTAGEAAGYGDINGATGISYKPGTLTDTTWYRRLSRVICKPDWTTATPSNVVKITVDTLTFSISGFVKYNNNPKTPLNWIKVVLKEGNVLKDSLITGTNGYYKFNHLINGTYSLVVKSGHPGGNWQTWSGVNNTDYLLALRHATTGPLLLENPPVVRISGDVKAPQTPPVITTVDADAIRMAAKYGWGNPPYFQIPKWVFSGVNLSLALDNISLNCGNATRDLLGLCAGDVNGSYLPPNGYKMAEPTLELANRGTLPITREITFPVRAERDMELGAITLMLDYDPSLIEITGVTMPDDGGVEPWFVVQSSKLKVAATLNLEPETLNLEPGTLNILHIGWASLNPINVSHDETVMLIHARPSSFVLRPSSLVLRFTLNESPLSELANGEGNVIDGAKLSVADAETSGKTVKWQNGKVVCYPNPAHSTLNLELETPSPGTLSLELVNLQGVPVITSEPGTVAAGWHKEQLDLRGLAPGVYFLRVDMNGDIIIKKVVISR
jgi:surface protein